MLSAALACVGLGLNAPARAWAQVSPASEAAGQARGQDSGQAAGQTTGQAPAAAAVQVADPQAFLPEEGKDLRIDEQIGKEIPRDIPFVDHTGKSVTMADYLDGNLPVILTFNYSSCPMLCNSQFNGLIEGMNQLVFMAGEQYRVVSVAIDHLETPATASDTRAQYVARFPEGKRSSVERGWTFLTGEKQNIRELADSVGFPYRYLEDQREYAHPASLIFLSPTGIVTRYYHGIYYEPQELSKSIFQAGVGEHGVSVGFLLACLRPSHQEGYRDTGFAVMQYGGIGFVLFLLAAFGTWQMIRARSARQEQIG